MSSHELTIILFAAYVVAVGMSLLLIYIKRFVRVPPNKAMVIYGSGHGARTARGKDGKPVRLSGVDIVTGGGRFVPPIVKDYAFLDLSTRSVEAGAEKLVVRDGEERFRLSARATAQYRIPSEPKKLRAAAEHLLHKPGKEIDSMVAKVLEGHLRGSIVATGFHGAEANIEKVAIAIQKLANRDLEKLGLELLAAQVLAFEGSAIGPVASGARESLRREVEEVVKRLDEIEKRLTTIEHALR